jgi:hypothetical protein
MADERNMIFKVQEPDGGRQVECVAETANQAACIWCLDHMVYVATNGEVLVQITNSRGASVALTVSLRPEAN